MKAPRDKQVTISVNLYLANDGSNGYLTFASPLQIQCVFSLAETFHTITFRLDGNAKELSFCGPNGSAHAGLQWTDNAPACIEFGPLPNDKKSIVLHNRHTEASRQNNNPRATRGLWHYRLFAKTSNNVVYSTPLTTSNGGANSNPSIKNV